MRVSRNVWLATGLAVAVVFPGVVFAASIGHRHRHLRRARCRT